MTYPDTMIDIESLGKKPGCVIMSIGAVKFNLGQGTIDRENTFHRVISIGDSTRHGFTIDGSTVAWWLGQPSEAQMAATRSPDTVATVLNEFTDWFGLCERPWGNSASFDLSILGEYYDRLGFERPWHFWNEMCYRTISNLWAQSVPKVEKTGVAHNAVDDALHQIERLMHIRDYMRRK